ncbi:bifunctional methylenetetrahydrofolate dehydrogenase/methenyltetrahydrofolate cyclohydrolase FolD [Buchnera aphidicola (Ceratoglyphina bambusae)]|uniref:bifunctional methylenetetrahydrofolate dehydrogenase/methenyltetrahydrofolate cyclohydrolase FolD n=1 Tax=Buchnera aphidicola TaxID=9 RepID=UPI0031B8AAEB
MLKKIIDGKKISKKLQEKICLEVKKKIKFGNRPPGIAVILVGNDSSSKIYIREKQIACKKVGFVLKCWKLQENTKEEKILNLINKLNKDLEIDGILVQLPLPKHINTNNILCAISYKKDIDGFHPYNIGKLCQKNPNIRACTPKGIITLLKKYKINTCGLNAVIIGDSNIVGKPMSMELLMYGCTTTITHKFTKNLKKHTKNADLLIVAIGKPNFIKKSWVKKKSIIFDVGINRMKNGKIIGDVNFKSVYKKISYITPVPGGVGPMTVTSLLENTMLIYNKNYKI